MNNRIEFPFVESLNRPFKWIYDPKANNTVSVNISETQTDYMSKLMTYFRIDTGYSIPCIIFDALKEYERSEKSCSFDETKDFLEVRGELHQYIDENGEVLPLSNEIQAKCYETLGYDRVTRWRNNTYLYSPKRKGGGRDRVDHDDR